MTYAQVNLEERRTTHLIRLDEPGNHDAIRVKHQEALDHSKSPDRLIKIHCMEKLGI